jgi:photosynthetic reaction center H subunit
MIRGALGHMDVAQVTIWAFWLFFAGLVYWLRKEDRREGYPLESEGVPQFNGDRGFLLIPTPKSFRLANGDVIQAPRFDEKAAPYSAEKVEPWPGAPIAPKGDPLLANVGPGAYNLRPDKPYNALDGSDLVQPLRAAKHFALSPEGGNPIGLPVVGADNSVGGKVVDVWVDISESVVRYYEVQLADGTGNIILPVYFGDVQWSKRRVLVNALTGAQFTKAPRLKNPNRITMAEEDKVAAYIAAGTLYRDSERAEPFI